MSHEGKMQRGEQWYSHRNLDGKMPDNINNDENKMEDVKYFLDNQGAKPVVKKKGTSTKTEATEKSSEDNKEEEE